MSPATKRHSAEFWPSLTVLTLARDNSLRAVHITRTELQRTQMTTVTIVRVTTTFLHFIHGMWFFHLFILHFCLQFERKSKITIDAQILEVPVSTLAKFRPLQVVWYERSFKAKLRSVRANGVAQMWTGKTSVITVLYFHNCTFKTYYTLPVKRASVDSEYQQHGNTVIKLQNTVCYKFSQRSYTCRQPCW